MQIGYAVIPAQALTYPAVAELCGPALLDAWLEHPGHPEGLKLRSGLPPASLALGPQGLNLAQPIAAIPSWPQGRVFRPDVELRWELLPDGALHLVLITVGAQPPGFTGWAQLQALPAGEPEPAWLWGERKRQGWEEGRIPLIGRLYPDDWQEPAAAVLTQRFELQWQPDPAERPGVKVVVRYLKFVTGPRPTTDPRFTPGGQAAA